MRKYIASLVLSLIIFSSCEKMLIGPDPENTAKNNFYLLWQAYDENYAMFGVKNITGIRYTPYTVPK